MTDKQVFDEEDSLAPAAPRRKFPWGILVVVALFVLIPFFSWYGTWFGRPLSDARIEEYLSDKEKPRNVQHALGQIGDRIIAGDQGVKRWYPRIIEASRNPAPEVRTIAAWTMGQDNAHQEFHAALISLLSDPSPSVRHNAALQLVRFNDQSGRSELVAMLQPRTLVAEKAGVTEMIIEDEGIAVAAGAPVARIKGDNGEVSEVRATENGRVERVIASDDTRIDAGGAVMVLLPSAEQVRETLKALAIVGQLEDIPAIQHFTRQIPGVPDDVNKQAAQVIELIQKRAAEAR
ncbi:MAG TPA: HEAT repeat domain-containing protein [Blastocatellia bacterium]|nr:HEAT repeat domain-containing protein [Blastocatellia bacterium]